jgi:hypothetical protein
MKGKITLFYLYSTKYQTKKSIARQALNKLLVDPKSNIIFYVNRAWTTLFTWRWHCIWYGNQNTLKYIVGLLIFMELLTIIV